MWLSDLCRVTQLVSGRVACIPGHCPFALAHWAPGIAPEIEFSSFHVPCTLFAQHFSYKTWGSDDSSLSALLLGPPQLGILPSNSSTLCSLKPPQHQARAYYSEIIITKSKNQNLPFEINPSNLGGKGSLRSLLRYHLHDFPCSPGPRALFTQYSYCMWGSHAAKQ